MTSSDAGLYEGFLTSLKSFRIYVVEVNVIVVNLQSTKRNISPFSIIYAFAVSVIMLVLFIKLFQVRSRGKVIRTFTH